MTCQNSVTIEMRVTGTVVYPQVRKRKREREREFEGGGGGGKKKKPWFF